MEIRGAISRRRRLMQLVCLPLASKTPVTTQICTTWVSSGPRPAQPMADQRRTTQVDFRVALLKLPRVLIIIRTETSRNSKISALRPSKPESSSKVRSRMILRLQVAFGLAQIAPVPLGSRQCVIHLISWYHSCLVTSKKRLVW